MMRNAASFATLLLTVLAVSCGLLAQQSDAMLAVASGGPPRVIQFNGVWNGMKGGVVGFTFAIYKDQEGGAALWMETQNLQVDGKGHYTALLGSTKPEGMPRDIFSTGEARWVGITANGEKEQPRVLLVAVPYALHAADAETVGGLPPSAFVLNPQAGVNGATSTAKGPNLTLMPGKKSKSALTTAVAGSGTADFIPLWTPDGSTLGNSALFQAAGPKIGIDTQTPATKLDVNGAATVRGVLKLPAVGAATTGAGKNSRTLDLAASAFNSISNAAEDETFVWQAEPAQNNTGNASATLNLLFAHGTATPAETGLSINSSGVLKAIQTGTTGSALVGVASATGNVLATGVEGDALGDFGHGVAGNATGASGSGVQGTTTADKGTGVVGVHNNAVGSGVGVSGTTVSALGTGVLGVHNNASTTGFGVQGTSQNGVGVAGSASAGIAGKFTNSSAANPAVLATNSSTGPIFQAFSGSTRILDLEPSRLTMTVNGSSAILGDLGCSAGFVGLQFGTPASCVRASVIGDGTNTIINRDSGGRLDFREENFTQMSLASGGNLGLGTVTPAKQLDVLGVSGSSHVAMAQFGSAGAHDSNSVLVYDSSGFAEVFAVGNTNNFVPNSAAGDGGLRVNAGHTILFGDAGADRMSIDKSGQITVFSSGSNFITGKSGSGINKFRVDGTGKGFFDGGTQTSGADFAESVAVSRTSSRYEPGDLLVVDKNGRRQLALSGRPYSTLVAGIYSTKPGVLATPHGMNDHAENEVPLAIVGIVPCKVTAENGRIRAGDLLVSSSTPGYAMKGTNRNRMLGAVVGKALEPLNTDKGIIQVLVTLQ